MKNKHAFNVSHTLTHIKEYLPAQSPLKDFIHHNTLHSFQEESFHEALVKASNIFGYKTYLSLEEYRERYKKGEISEVILTKIIQKEKPKESIEYWKAQLIEETHNQVKNPRIGFLRNSYQDILGIDLDTIVHPLFFRLVSSYLDQGIAIWNFPVEGNRFIEAIQLLEKNNFVSLFKTKKVKDLLFSKDLSIVHLLQLIIGEDEGLYEQYLFDQQFAHPGWSGMIAQIEKNNHTLLDPKIISLNDTILLELLMELDAIYSVKGKDWKPDTSALKSYAKDLFTPITRTSYDEIKRIWQEAFEWTYYNQVLNALVQVNKKESLPSQKSLQALFCIDDRECSFRRYVEQLDANSQTYGTAGFFNLAFYFQPQGGKFLTKVCPAPMNPHVVIKEVENKAKRKKDVHFHKQTHSLFLGSLLTHTLGLWSGLKLAYHIFKPGKTSTMVSATKHMDKNASLTIAHKGEFTKEGHQIGFTLDEMVEALHSLLQSIGLVKEFAPLVYIIGHGSSSLNNTHYAGYDCGACSGRPGSVNARAMAWIANQEVVRVKLKEKGIEIPSETQFVGAIHDTSRDEIQFFDVSVLSDSNFSFHKQNVLTFKRALDLNAKERSRRFVTVPTHKNAKKVHELVKLRTVAYFEPRPELNHATNTLCIVGRRSFSKKVFLDRRAFMNSYDYTVDPSGIFLRGILNAVAPVCGGINLEYYFSRVDNQKLGAGSKLPHNVVGLFGVANGTDGDLRTGLPSQMIELHDPMRLMVIVEHEPEVVLDSIRANNATYQWFEKEWIHLVVFNPKDEQMYRFENGNFVPCMLEAITIPFVKNLEALFEKESGNLDVCLINT